MEPKLINGGTKKRVLNDDTNSGMDHVNPLDTQSKRANPFKTAFAQKRSQMRDLHIATLEQIDKDMMTDHATCPSGIQWAPYLALPGFDHLDKDEQSGWRLSTILFDDNDTKRPKWTRFREWLLDRVSTGAELAAKRVQLRVPDDPYAVVFEYLTYGCIELAARAALDLAKDEALGCLIAMAPASSQAMRQTYRDLFDNSIASEAFEMFSPYEKGCWYALCGQPDKCLTMDDGNGNNFEIDWRQAFVLYMLYYWVDEDQDPMDTVMEHYVRNVEPFFYDRGDETDVRPTWFVVFRWWWKQQYHLELAHLDRHPLHLQDWSPRLAYCFTLFFPKALLPTKNKEVAQRFLYELKRVGVSDVLIPETLQQ